jgi:rSAM/selenodomain-associated transferase 2
VLIDLPWQDFEGRIRATEEALAAGAPAMYEAAFSADGVFVAVDILERTGNGFTLIEVKSTTRVKEEHIADATKSALDAGVHEVIVVDGGSIDSTAERARASGAVVLEAPRGRARQVSAGAAEAVGDVLLFLHADSRLPPSAVADIAAALGGDDVAMGAFQFDAGNGHACDRLMSWAGRTRHRVFGLPYGDQGQFLRRRDFEDLGGMPQIPVMEEWELARRCARLGRIATAPSRAWTSGRAWREHGVVRVVAVNGAVIAGYRLGADPEDLARWRAGIAPAKRPGVR